MDEDRANVLFARYVEHLVVEGTRLSATELAAGDPEFVAALEERIKAFGRVEEALSRTPETLTGTSLGHYRILECLGFGGMGEVYRAEDTSLHRDVAIKVLPSLLALDPRRRARFEREARLLASLDHPNIEAIHGTERSGDRPFLVLELIGGETLAERIARGPIPLEETCRIFVEIARALEATHASGIVHRDLKPANVKITPGGHAKVLDFGLGKTLGDDLATLVPSVGPSQNTVSGVILGTASYMSPEQARGKPVDQRTDVWSFGCVLYEALTGRVAFREDSFADTLSVILHREPDWRELPATTPGALRRLLRRCLEKDAAMRPSGLAEARRTLQDVLEGAPARTSRRTIALVLTAALIVVFGASLVSRGKSPAAPPKGHDGSPRLETPAPKAGLIVDREAYRSRLRETYARWRAGFARSHPSFTAASLAICVTTREPPALHVIDARTLAVTASIPLPAKASHDRLLGVATSPDGARAYVASLEADRVFVVDLKTKTVLPVPDGSGIAVSPRPAQIALTPDGARGYVTSLSGAVAVIDTDAKSPRCHTVLDVPDGKAIRVGTEPTGIAIAPGATRAYVTDILGDAIFIIDIDPSSARYHTVVGSSDGQSVRIGLAMSGVAFTPDGARVYVASTLLNQVSVIETEAASGTLGRLIAEIKTGTYPHWLAVSPDGSRVYVTNRDGPTVSLIDTVSDVVALPPLEVGLSASQLVLSPDGTRAFVASLNAREISVLDTDPTSATFHSVVATIPVKGRPYGVALAMAPALGEAASARTR